MAVPEKMREDRRADPVRRLGTPGRSLSPRGGLLHPEGGGLDHPAPICPSTAATTYGLVTPAATRRGAPAPPLLRGRTALVRRGKRASFAAYGTSPRHQSTPTAVSTTPRSPASRWRKCASWWWTARNSRCATPRAARTSPFGTAADHRRARRRGQPMFTTQLLSQIIRFTAIPAGLHGQLPGAQPAGLPRPAAAVPQPAQHRAQPDPRSMLNDMTERNLDMWKTLQQGSSMPRRAWSSPRPAARAELPPPLARGTPPRVPCPPGGQQRQDGCVDSPARPA